MSNPISNLSDKKFADLNAQELNQVYVSYCDENNYSFDDEHGNEFTRKNS